MSLCITKLIDSGAIPPCSPEEVFWFIGVEEERGTFLLHMEEHLLGRGESGKTITKAISTEETAIGGHRGHPL